MKFRKRALLSLFVFCCGLGLSHARNIQDVDLKWREVSGKVTIFLDKGLLSSPDLEIKGSKIRIKLGSQDTLEKAFQWSGDTISFNARKNLIEITTPYALGPHKGKVLIDIKKDTLEIIFPKLKAKAFSAKEEKTEAKSGSYLKKLIEEQKNQPEEMIQEAVSDKEDKVASDSKLLNREVAPSESSAWTEPSSQEKTDFVGLFTKFFGFLLLVLGLFFMIVVGLKKAGFRKGKVGILSKSDLIQVIQTTHLSPKDSLMLVKVHDQVLLLGKSEQSGLQKLTEMNSVADLLKTADKAANGSNFDQSLQKVEKSPQKELKIKQNPLQHSESPGAARITPRFSDEIRQKIKNLRPMQ